MEKTLPLYLGPSVIGSVTLSGDDNGLYAAARTYATLPGICRAYIKSNYGEALIGVLSPDGSSFAASRNFSKALLTEVKLSLEEVSYAYALCKENNAPNIRWKDAGSVSDTSAFGEIVSTLIFARGAKVDSTEHPKKVALPLFSGRPFPRADVLCLMTPMKIDGETFGVLGISKNGEPEKI